jgi:predicted membrane GTPase involved in stress response
MLTFAHHVVSPRLLQVAFEMGTTTSYALVSCQERGKLFVKPGMDVYKNQIVGIHQRPGDLQLNVCKKKAATNVRSNADVKGTEHFVILLARKQTRQVDSCFPTLVLLSIA